MCQLCSEDTRASHQAALCSFAERLERMAALVRQIARGDIKVHTPEVNQKTEPLAHSIIRELVEDWM